ncbi:MAG: restriction endonuclease subunit S [Candidatus Thiodiazotropha sp.]
MSDIHQEAWPTSSLGEFAEFKNGINFTKAQKGEVGVPTIDVKNMYGYGFAAGVENLYRVDKEIKDDYFLKKGDLLFVRSSLKQEGIGWTAQFVSNSEPTTYCGFIIRARLNDQDRTDPSFLTFYFRSDEARRALIASSGKVAITNISQGILSKVPIPLPPLPEQKKIAHILSTVQRSIEAQERIIQTTTELKKALMHKLFTEGLRNEPQKQTEIGPVPESWEVKKIGEVADLKSGGTPSRKKPEYWAGGAIPWIKTGEVDYCIITDTEEKITKDGLEQSSAKLFPAGTLIMAMYGQGITRGKVAMLGIEASTNQACVAFFPSQEVDSRFLFFFFENSYEGIRSFAHGANQKNLSSEIIKTFPVSYPKDKEEQKEITDTLDELDNKIRIHQKKKEVYQDLFCTLLHELMTAKTRITGIPFPQPPERT